MNNILGTGFSSRLFSQVRSEQALHPEEPDIDAQVVPNGTTIALKRVAHQIASTILSASASSVIAIKASGRLENPWLRAVLVAPSVHRFLTTLALGARDFRTLAALMVKPRSAVMMTFAGDANPGLAATLVIPARAGSSDRLASQTQDVPQKVA